MGTWRVRASANVQVKDECVYAKQIVHEECGREGGRQHCGEWRAVVMPPRKSNPRAEYRLKQRARIEGSPCMAQRFPRLKALTVNLAYYDAEGFNKIGEMKCKLNVEHAKSVLWFACPGGECVGGDFDLSEALEKAVAGRCKAASGEMRCRGQRTRGDRERVPCPALLRYKMILDYGRRA